MSPQASDPDTAHAATVAGALRVVVGQLVRRLREQAHPGAVTWSQMSVLGRLERDGPATVTRLARAEGVRPQSMRLATQDTKLKINVDMVEFLGTESLISGHVVGAPEQRICAVFPGNSSQLRRQQIGLDFSLEELHLFDNHTGQRLS